MPLNATILPVSIESFFMKSSLRFLTSCFWIVAFITLQGWPCALAFNNNTHSYQTSTQPTQSLQEKLKERYIDKIKVEILDYIDAPLKLATKSPKNTIKITKKKKKKI